jgi:hypothetical protein
LSGSQFSAILPIFGEKIVRFSQKPMYDHFFEKIFLSKKRLKLRPMFRRKYIEIHNIGPEALCVNFQFYVRVDFKKPVSFGQNL